MTIEHRPPHESGQSFPVYRGNGGLALITPAVYGLN
jgi:hypothetical protein